MPPLSDTLMPSPLPVDRPPDWSFPMKTVLSVSLLPALLFVLSGCASQKQMDAQNAQLAVINQNLTQIQAGQAQSLELQRQQLTLQTRSNVLQQQQYEAQLKRQ
jgi:murein lipoprotein